MSDGMVIVDATHWLTEDGDLPVDAPMRLFRNAHRVAQCIEYGGPLPPEHSRLTLIGCRRRPGGTACRGTLVVVKTERDEIYAFCAVCRSEEFLITNWQDTLFADGPPEPLPVGGERDEHAPDETDLPPTVRRQLEQALSGTRCQLSTSDVVRLIATSDSPNDIVRAVAQASAPPRDVAHAQSVMSALMAAWNATPRAELGGRSPEQVHGEAEPRQPARAAPKIGRNQPCPCQSGKKYKRCCGQLH